MKELKFSEIVRLNNELKNTSNAYSIAILSNITVHQINPILEYALKSENIDAKCTIGDYDNIVQDSKTFSDRKLVVIFWELANLIDGFQYISNDLSSLETEQYLTRFKSEIDFVFKNLSTTSLVILNKFSTLIFNHHFSGRNNFDQLCQELNNYILKNAPANVEIVEIDRVIASVSIDKSVNFRDFYSSKNLYSIDFLKSYVVIYNSNSSIGLRSLEESSHSGL